MIGVNEMEGKFIYVFSVDARDKLSASNYNLIKSDEKRNLYVFENNGALTFSNDIQSYVYSDILTF